MNKYESGQISRTLIILAIVVLVAIVIVYGVLKIAASRKAQTAKTDAQLAQENEPPKPVHEVTVGQTRFLFDSAIDLGPVIKAQNQYQQDITTTEKFIYLTIRAQNKGKADTAMQAWDIGPILDAEGRNFIEDQRAYYFLPKPNLCGAILKPEFEPTPCVKIYQVSKASDHLKVQVIASDPSSGKRQEGFLDLEVR